MAERLARRPEFADAGVDLLHGQMPGADKDAVMTRFVRGETGILVATTVVEVGIDVPNAAFLIIEHPERYGLSQLHQLRGRIGRGAHTSYCVLIAGADLDPAAGERLAIFAGTEDGFELAERDLELRGQGDVAGVRQSGRPGFRLADPVRDRELVEQARREARELLEAALLGDGGTEWEPLRRELADRLAAAGDLADAG
jgi:ATP-dependent DNA helicase RecG